MEATQITPERPEIGKTFRVTRTQDQVIRQYLADEADSFGNFTQIIETALHEFFQRRRIVWPETKRRRPWE